MGILETLILTTFLAGVAGTGLGGLIGAMLQKDSNRTVSLLLSFAGGVMLSVVCFDLVTEAIETNVGVWAVVGAIAFGVSVTYFLNYLIDRKTNPEVPHIDANHPKTADDLDELIHSDHLEQHYARKDSRMGLFVAGIVMASAIALHNVPEGMTIGASYASNDGLLGTSALVLAVIIGLHNIPDFQSRAQNRKPGSREGDTPLPGNSWRRAPDGRRGCCSPDPPDGTQRCWRSEDSLC